MYYISYNHLIDVIFKELARSTEDFNGAMLKAVYYISLKLNIYLIGSS